MANNTFHVKLTRADSTGTWTITSCLKNASTSASGGTNVATNYAESTSTSSLRTPAEALTRAMNWIEAERAVNGDA